MIGEEGSSSFSRFSALLFTLIQRAKTSLFVFLFPEDYSDLISHRGLLIRIGYQNLCCQCSLDLRLQQKACQLSVYIPKKMPQVPSISLQYDTICTGRRTNPAICRWQNKLYRTRCSMLASSAHLHDSVHENSCHISQIQSERGSVCLGWKITPRAHHFTILRFIPLHFGDLGSNGRRACVVRVVRITVLKAFIFPTHVWVMRLLGPHERICAAP
ncbi:hypothetical protein CPB84DRAFT_1469282 [Gymnopilus junonius]|uniref:Uncharacterized protein n=1 Tax=Gymnopilus junonius TaxID=109634 RepID=A0A9P5NK42_GYMJU|nr:hypothetical protein CPB84DRAFT_1469282 [Gymnopilus junonius]